MKKGFVANYWEKRYRGGGNSGLGSYDSEAVNFKGNYINDLIAKYNVRTIFDYGCGDGNQLKFINGYEKYYGTDISEDIINKCKIKYKDDTTKVFEHDLTKILDKKYDLSISMDVIYHLVEDDLFAYYVNNLFLTSDLVSIYTTDKPSGPQSAHVKHRKISEYIAETHSDFVLLDKSLAPKFDTMFLTYGRKS